MEEFNPDRDEVVRRARDAGVIKILLAACDEASSGEIFRMVSSERENESGVNFLASVGVHPHEASGVAGGLPEGLVKLSGEKKIAAIGEIGLDYYYDNSPRKIQRDAFERQIDVAVRVRKPVILHLRNAQARGGGDAYGEAMAVIKNFPDLIGGVVHCFSGDKPDARAALDLGFYVSFAGPLTYPKAEELREAAKYSPLDRILCETDSPYLAPRSKRGRRNEPALVADVYAKLAEVRGLTLGETARAVWDNGVRLFG